MNGIQLSQEMSRLARELLDFEIPQVVGVPQFFEQACGLALDVLGIAEWIAAFRYPNGARLPGPIVNVLEEVIMDGTVVFEIQCPFRERFIGARAGNLRLESVKIGLNP